MKSAHPLADRHIRELLVHCSRLLTFSVHLSTDKTEELSSGEALPTSRIEQAKFRLESANRNSPLLSCLVRSCAAAISELTLEMTGLSLTSVSLLFEQCPRLQSLTLILSAVPDAASTMLTSSSSSLMRLSVQNDTRENNFLLEVARKCAVLQELHVANSVLDVVSIVRVLPRLTKLVVVDSSHEAASDDAAGESCKLRQLVLYDYDGLSDELLVQMAGRCPELQELDLAEMEGITYGGLSQVLNLCSQLVTLKMADCLGLKEMGHQKFPLNSISRLGVSGCKHSAWDAIVAVAAGSCGLRHVSTTRLPALTADQLAVLLVR